MQIVYEQEFQVALKRIVAYIAIDKASASASFKKELKKKFEMLLDNPRMYKRSKYFDDVSYRDMTFKGYTVIYKIASEDELRVLDIFKWVDR